MAHRLTAGVQQVVWARFDRVFQSTAIQEAIQATISRFIIFTTKILIEQHLALPRPEQINALKKMLFYIPSIAASSDRI